MSLVVRGTACGWELGGSALLPLPFEACGTLASPLCAFAYPPFVPALRAEGGERSSGGCREMPRASLRKDIDRPGGRLSTDAAWQRGRRAGGGRSVAVEPCEQTEEGLPQGGGQRGGSTVAVGGKSTCRRSYSTRCPGARSTGGRWIWRAAIAAEGQPQWCTAGGRMRLGGTSVVVCGIYIDTLYCTIELCRMRTVWARVQTLCGG